MKMIAFITIKSSLVPLIEGLCDQIYFRFETSVPINTGFVQQIQSGYQRVQVGL